MRQKVDGKMYIFADIRDNDNPDSAFSVWWYLSDKPQNIDTAHWFMVIEFSEKIYVLGVSSRTADYKTIVDNIEHVNNRRCNDVYRIRKGEYQQFIARANSWRHIQARKKRKHLK